MAKKIEYKLVVKDLASKTLRNVSKGLKGIGKAAKAATAPIRNLFSSFAGRLAAIGGVGGALYLFRRSIQEAFSFESIQVRFTKLLGSLDSAKKRLSDIQKLADRTPFEFKELANVNVQLEKFTQGALSSVDWMTKIGDAAADAQKPIEEVSSWIARLYANLKAGEPIGDATAELLRLGVITPDVKQKLEDAAKSTGGFNKAMKILNSELKKSKGAMEALSKTGGGLISTLRSKWTDALRVFGTAFMDAAKEGIQLLIDTLDTLLKNGTIEEWGKTAAAAVENAGLKIKEFVTTYITGEGGLVERLKAVDWKAWGDNISSAVNQIAEAASKTAKAINAVSEAAAKAKKIGSKLGIAMPESFSEPLERGLPPVPLRPGQPGFDTTNNNNVNSPTTVNVTGPSRAGLGVPEAAIAPSGEGVSPGQVIKPTINAYINDSGGFTITADPGFEGVQAKLGEGNVSTSQLLKESQRNNVKTDTVSRQLGQIAALLDQQNQILDDQP